MPVNPLQTAIGNVTRRHGIRPTEKLTPAQVKEVQAEAKAAGADVTLKDVREAREATIAAGAAAGVDAGRATASDRAASQGSTAGHGGSTVVNSVIAARIGATATTGAFDGLAALKTAFQAEMRAAGTLQYRPGIEPDPALYDKKTLSDVGLGGYEPQRPSFAGPGAPVDKIAVWVPKDLVAGSKVIVEKTIGGGHFPAQYSSLTLRAPPAATTATAPTPATPAAPAFDPLASLKKAFSAEYRAAGTLQYNPSGPSNPGDFVRKSLSDVGLDGYEPQPSFSGSDADKLVVLYPKDPKPGAQVWVERTIAGDGFDPDFASLKLR